MDGFAMRRDLTTLGAVITVVLLTATRAPAVEAEVQRIETRPGVTQPFLLVRPDGPPVASVILFAGGHGRLALGEQGIGWGRGNFLVRTRRMFAQHGFLVAVVDAPSDRAGDQRMDFRTSEPHARDMAAVIAFLRKAAGGPVWLVGTSAGTLSAANAAVRLKEGGANGLVLTSTVTRSSRVLPQSVPDLGLKDVSVPTLVVHHKQDACVVTRPADVPALVKGFERAPKVELIWFEGGAEPRSEPCEAQSYHGFQGLEAEVVGAIARWIKTASGIR